MKEKIVNNYCNGMISDAVASLNNLKVCHSPERNLALFCSKAFVAFGLSLHGDFLPFSRQFQLALVIARSPIALFAVFPFVRRRMNTNAQDMTRNKVIAIDNLKHNLLKK